MARREAAVWGTEVQPRRHTQSRPGWRSSVKPIIGWTILVMASVFFFVEAALPFFTWSEETYHRFWVNAPWLLAHVIGGSIALVMGPWQFWIALRTRFQPVHRWTGRVYLAGVALAAISGFYLAFYSARIAFGAGLLALDVAWVISTVMAYVAIRKRRIAKHREWMIRSYMLTLAFVSLRFWLLLALSLELGDPNVVVPAVGWVSWVAPLVLVEIILRRGRSRSVRV